eukprot:14086146-Alexandrium_andersonii.AAC.1
MHLASYSLAVLARTQDPAVWPGALAQVLWAGVAEAEGGIAAPDELATVLRAHNCRPEAFMGLLQDMAGMGISSQQAMLDYMVGRADAATLAALQPSGTSDLRVGCQVPPCMLRTMVGAWQEQLCDAVQYVGETGVWDEPSEVLTHHVPLGMHWRSPVPSAPGIHWAGPRGLAPSPLLLYETLSLIHI